MRRITPRTAEIARVYLENPFITLKEVGQRFGGITNEAVRQHVALFDPDGDERKKRRAERERIKAEQQARADWATLRERSEKAEPCPVCGCWVLRGSFYVTCSPECAKVWTLVRFRLAEDIHEQHRFNQARTILRRPEKYKSNQVSWAKRMLSDSPPPPNRRFVWPSSKTTAIVARIEGNHGR